MEKASFYLCIASVTERGSFGLLFTITEHDIRSAKVFAMAATPLSFYPAFLQTCSVMGLISIDVPCIDKRGISLVNEI